MPSNKLSPLNDNAVALASGDHVSVIELPLGGKRIATPHFGEPFGARYFECVTGTCGLEKAFALDLVGKAVGCLSALHIKYKMKMVPLSDDFEGIELNSLAYGRGLLWLTATDQRGTERIHIVKEVDGILTIENTLDDCEYLNGDTSIYGDRSVVMCVDNIDGNIFSIDDAFQSNICTMASTSLFGYDAEGKLLRFEIDTTNIVVKHSNLEKVETLGTFVNRLDCIPSSIALVGHTLAILTGDILCAIQPNGHSKRLKIL